jgi:hypothetical protein
MDLTEIEYYGVEWITVAQDRGKRRLYVNAVINRRVRYNAADLLTGCGNRQLLRKDSALLSY